LRIAAQGSERIQHELFNTHPLALRGLKFVSGEWPIGYVPRARGYTNLHPVSEIPASLYLIEPKLCCTVPSKN